MDNSIGWGKCGIIVKDLDTVGSKWVKLPTPKEGSTELSPSKGDKLEAPVEGGGNEDVKYSKNTYEIAYSIRRNASRKKPFKDNDGVVSGHYAIFVQPENKSVPGPLIEKTSVSLEDPFNTSDGGLLTYTHSALVPDSGNTVKWVTCNVDLLDIKEGTEITETLTFTDIDSGENVPVNGSTE